MMYKITIEDLETGLHVTTTNEFDSETIEKLFPGMFETLNKATEPANIAVKPIPNAMNKDDAFKEVSLILQKVIDLDDEYVMNKIYIRWGRVEKALKAIMKRILHERACS